MKQIYTVQREAVILYNALDDLTIRYNAYYNIFNKHLNKSKNKSYLKQIENTKYYLYIYVYLKYR